ncbi:hypothetical protein [Acinetobacter baumannii]|uniref:hypothetical protein n=1 Tax=Acinetobacter baumannii TaxID=470 RepID=UPI0037BFAC0C
MFTCIGGAYHLEQFECEGSKIAIHILKRSVETDVPEPLPDLFKYDYHVYELSDHEFNSETKTFLRFSQLTDIEFAQLAEENWN